MATVTADSKTIIENLAKRGNRHAIWALAEIARLTAELAARTDERDHYAAACSRIDQALADTVAQLADAVQRAQEAEAARDSIAAGIRAGTKQLRDQLAVANGLLQKIALSLRGDDFDGQGLWAHVDRETETEIMKFLSG